MAIITYNGMQYDTAAWDIDSLHDAGVSDADIDSARRSDAHTRIDAAAGRARMRFVSRGSLTVEEYRAAADAVKRWRAAGSPADDVPREITTGAEYSSVNNEQSAVEIEQKASADDARLADIRDIRLPGKRAVAEASGDDIDAAADAAITQLDAIQPPADPGV